MRRKHSFKKFSEIDIIKMLKFLIINIDAAMFAVVYFNRQSAFICVPNCASILANLFLYSYKTDLKHGILNEANKGNNKITELRTILQRESQNS